MFESGGVLLRVRNLSVYGIGVALATVGAVGLAGAVALESTLAVICFIFGIAIVLAVHEFLGGPV